MPQNEIGLLMAFGAGFASFVSPCVLPLVPAYLSFMSGVSLQEMKSGSARKLRGVFITSLAFVCGFSLVFIALGASATALGQKLLGALPVLARVAGVIIIIFGIHMTGLIRIPMLAYEKRFQTGGGGRSLFSAFIMGLAFAFGWTPCIGPILAAILAVAANAETINQGVLLLAAYSAGLGIPFLLTGLFLNVFYGFFGRIQRHFHKIEVVSGVVLILVGVLLVSNRFDMLAYWLAENLNIGELG